MIMAASFSVTCRFWRQNYPRGFSRHGDYTIKESQVLEQYGQAFKALDSGERKPATKEEKNLLHLPWWTCTRNFLRKTWNKYRTSLTQQNVFTPYLVMWAKRLLSGEDYSGE